MHIFWVNSYNPRKHWDTSSWQWTRNAEGRHLLPKKQLWWGLLFLQLSEQVLHPVLPSFPSSALYSTKVSGRPTFHWTLGFRRCLRNCKIPPVDQSFIKPPELAKSFSNAVPSRLQGFAQLLKFCQLGGSSFGGQNWTPDSPYSVSVHLQTSLSQKKRFSCSADPSIQKILPPHSIEPGVMFENETFLLSSSFNI